jgi:hypothetical protein
MFNNLATACAAFLLGIAIRWLWSLTRRANDRNLPFVT